MVCVSPLEATTYRVHGIQRLSCIHDTLRRQLLSMVLKTIPSQPSPPQFNQPDWRIQPDSQTDNQPASQLVRWTDVKTDKQTESASQPDRQKAGQPDKPARERKWLFANQLAASALVRINSHCVLGRVRASGTRAATENLLSKQEKSSQLHTHIYSRDCRHIYKYLRADTQCRLMPCLGGVRKYAEFSPVRVVSIE